MSLPPSTGKTILITGINGYIASAIGLRVLSMGYNVRGTTRSRASTAALLNNAYEAYASRVEIVEIPDTTILTAFDEAVRGVSAIHHTAAPFDFVLQSWEEWVTPAVDTCNAILKSAASCAGQQLQCFVFLSSTVVSADPRDAQCDNSMGSEGYGLTEAMRCGLDPRVVAGRFAQASKTETEKVIWRWKKQHKPQFSICSVCPSVVTGPPTQAPPIASALNLSLRPIWQLFSGETSVNSQGFGVNEYIDVRDVATVHTWCMEHPDRIDNQRYTMSAGLGPPQAVADILRTAYPERKHIIPRGDPSKGYLPGFGFLTRRRKHLGTDAAEVIGLHYIKYDRSILDTAKVLERYL